MHHLDSETAAAMELADMHARERSRRRIYLIVIWGAVVVMLGTVLSVWLRDMTYWTHRLPKL